MSGHGTLEYRLKNALGHSTRDCSIMIQPDKAVYASRYRPAEGDRQGRRITVRLRPFRFIGTRPTDLTRSADSSGPTHVHRITRNSTLIIWRLTLSGLSATAARR